MLQATSRSLLESNRRAEGNPQVVVTPILEVDLVAHIETQPERAGEAFQSTPGRIAAAVLPVVTSLIAL